MITSKIRKSHLLLFVLLVIGLVLSLIGVALSLGEQHPEVGTFRLVFHFSVFGTGAFAVLLAVGMIYFRRRRRSLET